MRQPLSVCLAAPFVLLLAACTDSSGAGPDGTQVPTGADVEAATGEVALEDSGPDLLPTTEADAVDEVGAPDGENATAALTITSRALDLCGSFTPEHQTGVNYQTPTGIHARVLAVELLRARDDAAPLTLPLDAPLVDVDLSAGGTLARAPLGDLTPGTFAYARVTVASARYQLVATAHPSFIPYPVPGVLTVDMALSNHTGANGTPRAQGEYTATFEAAGQSMPRSGTTPLNCLLSAWGGLPSTAHGVFTVTVPLPGGPIALDPAAAAPITVSLDFPMRDAFSWRDRADTAFADGVLDMVLPPEPSELPDALTECNLFMADRCDGEAVVPYHPTWPMPDSAPAFCTNGSALVDPCPAPGAAGWGQDASYVEQPLSYEAADGAVRDLVTGLSWQQATPVALHDWWDARGYCQELTLAGHDDWRLPSRIEVVSILDFGRLDPVIDPTAFPDTPSDFYWTASPVPFLAFAYGIRFELGFIYDHDPHSTGRVRCVRGGYTPPSPRFTVDPAAGTVLDNGTGLMWERATHATPLGWLDSLARCEGLAFAGHDDWRLPTLKETQTLIDERRLQPAVDISAFPDTPAEWFWSSTPISTHPDQAWATSTTDGYASIHSGAELHRVRCVRVP